MDIPAAILPYVSRHSTARLDIYGWVCIEKCIEQMKYEISTHRTSIVRKDYAYFPTYIKCHVQFLKENTFVYNNPSKQDKMYNFKLHASDVF